MGELMKRNPIKMRRALERGEAWQADVVVTDAVVRFAVALANVGADCAR
jgi:hypothetical protein